MHELGRLQHDYPLDRGEPSKGMTAERAAKLEALGFAWDPGGAGWEEQLAKLKKYKRRHGDCSVPLRWAEDPVLGQWVNGQRKLKKALDRGEPSKGMTAERAAKLEALGFAWDKSWYPKGTSSSFRGVSRKKSEGKWIKASNAKRKAKAKAKKNAQNAKNKNAKRKSPTITHRERTERKEEESKAKAKTKKNTKRQRTAAIQTGWHMRAKN
jgi:hypothetical protein